MYSPKIREELIPRLYRIGKESKKPMTVIVDEFLKMAIAEYEWRKKRKSERTKDEVTD